LTRKKEKTPDIDPNRIDGTFNIFGACDTGTAGPIFPYLPVIDSGATTVNWGPPLTEYEKRMEQLLTDIWHNQASMIKWLEKINTSLKK